MGIALTNPISFSQIKSTLSLGSICDTLGTCESKAVSLSYRVWAATKEIFSKSVEYVQVISAGTPILSALIFLPLALCYGLSASIKRRAERQKQIKNALACCVIAMPFLGLFYLSKAFRNSALILAENNASEPNQIKDSPLSNSTLSCLVAAYWFPAKDLDDVLQGTEEAFSNS